MPNYKLQVEVIPQYLPEQSDPASDLYTFAYSITITNTGSIAAQVISRSWSVNDANGLHEKIKGLGVVGYQPLLQPGEKFQYTSGTRFNKDKRKAKGSCLVSNANSSMKLSEKKALCEWPTDRQ